jgi:hypothetical protein
VSSINRLQRQQLVREAEGYLDLTLVFGDQWILPAELRDRLAPAAGRLEGFAFADPAARLDRSRVVLGELGVSYLCAPGMLQSPPPSWAHGGGRFLQLMVSGDG